VAVGSVINQELFHSQQPKLPSVELNMLAPRIRARVEKRSLPVRFRIDAENVIGLPLITRVAAKR
jgi:hypothetical protein